MEIDAVVGGRPVDQAQERLAAALRIVSLRNDGRTAREERHEHQEEEPDRGRTDGVEQQVAYDERE